MKKPLLLILFCAFIARAEITIPIPSQHYAMGATPVSIETWNQVVSWGGNQGYKFDNTGKAFGAGHPVQTVSWYDAVKWCNARSEMEVLPPVYTVAGKTLKTGRIVPDVNTNGGYRLPTKAEWDFAARGGLVGKLFPNGDKIYHRDACYQSPLLPIYYDGGPFYVFPQGTVPCASLSTNGYGLRHMVGNVNQLCFDKGNTLGPVAAVGGSWKSLANGLTLTRGGSVTRDTAGNQIGFRVAKTLP